METTISKEEQQPVDSEEGLVQMLDPKELKEKVPGRDDWHELNTSTTSIHTTLDGEQDDNKDEECVTICESHHQDDEFEREEERNISKLEGFLVNVSFPAPVDSATVSLRLHYLVLVAGTAGVCIFVAGLLIGSRRSH